ncbi:hypothetical protein EYZ11_004448 [Aspergillus tanneri]|uniref:Uncharacterized protein n=1 Tax=Aspergillus tanneri TaxID=1220188 RepID=A0A4S3JL01_9EURO|nr:hypothetical protein EYZ11_004448 [Aspergillus tanneri]
MLFFSDQPRKASSDSQETGEEGAKGGDAIPGRKTLANGTWKTARKEYFHNAPVLKVDRQIKQLLGQSNNTHGDADSSEDKDCELPIPEYIFPKRARLVENFYGPEAENFDEDMLLERRIQVTKDMVALSQLCEPNWRGNRVNWDKDDNKIKKSEELLPPKNKPLECPTDVCIICYGLSQRSASNLLPINFLPSEKILSVAILLTLISPMRTTG